MKSNSSLSQAEKVSICAALYQKGMSTRDIEAATRIGKSSIPKYLRLAGVALDGAARIAAKMKGRPGARKGATHTAEAKAKISKARAGKANTTGQVRTLEQRAKMSAAQRASGKSRRVIRHQPMLFRRSPVPRLDPAERRARIQARQACKQMLRRVLTMARIRKDAKTETLLGYSKADLRAHIERQFRPGMSWQKRNSFHIDHIVPVAYFFRNGVYDPKVINALENLQVLTPAENRAKRDTITDSGVQAGIVDLA